jgi:hypothetical protein
VGELSSCMCSILGTKATSCCRDWRLTVEPLAEDFPSLMMSKTGFSHCD